MWRISDFFINLYLTIRLFILIKFKPKRFKNIYNGLEKKDWDLTFNDEFNGTELDRTKWRTDAYFGYRYHPGSIYEGIAPHLYWDDTYNLVENNKLIQLTDSVPIEIEHIDFDGTNMGKWTIPYRAGQIDSSISFEQKYGYFEIKSKITDQPGAWPAFWLASLSAWPPEIDVYEIYTGRKKGLTSFSSNFHWKKKSTDEDNKMKSKQHFVLDVSKDYHIYAVEWNEKYFKIFYDNLLIRKYSNPQALKYFKYPMHIIIGTGIHMEQGAENAIYPTTHEVEYVRAYKKN